MTSSLPTECQQLLISGYVLGNLSPTEAILLEEILQENPEARQQIVELQQALETVYSPPEVAPPTALREKLLAAKIEPERSARKSAADRVSTQWGKKLSWGKILVALGISSILGLGFTNYWFWQKLQRASLENLENSGLERLVYSLQGIDSIPEARGELVVNPNRLDGTLTVSNLPPLPPGKIYALWTVVGKEVPFTTDDKGAILTEVFHVNSQGEVSKNIIVPRVHRQERQIQKIAITVESESSPQAHQGSILMASVVN